MSRGPVDRVGHCRATVRPCRRGSPTSTARAASYGLQGGAVQGINFKGLKTSIKAWREACQRTLTVVGKGAERQHIRKAQQAAIPAESLLDRIIAGQPAPETPEFDSALDNMQNEFESEMQALVLEVQRQLEPGEGTVRLTSGEQRRVRSTASSARSFFPTGAAPASRTLHESSVRVTVTTASSWRLPNATFPYRSMSAPWNAGELSRRGRQTLTRRGRTVAVSSFRGDCRATAFQPQSFCDSTTPTSGHIDRDRPRHRPAGRHVRSRGSGAGSSHALPAEGVGRRRRAPPHHALSPNARSVTAPKRQGRRRSGLVRRAGFCRRAGQRR